MTPRGFLVTRRRTNPTASFVRLRGHHPWLETRPEKRNPLPKRRGRGGHLYRSTPDAPPPRPHEPAGTHPLHSPRFAAPFSPVIMAVAVCMKETSRVRLAVVVSARREEDDSCEVDHHARRS